MTFSWRKLCPTFLKNKVLSMRRQTIEILNSTNFENVELISTMDCNKSSSSSSTEIFSFIHDGNNEFNIEDILQKGIDIEVRDTKGYTPLQLASALGRKDIVELLIKYGANVNYCDGDGQTVLHHASQKGWTNIVLSLVKEVHDLDARNKNGETALHNAVVLGSLEVVKCLVEEGADINVKTRRGATPLLYAAKHSHKDIFNLLLSAGANVNDCDCEKRSVLQHVLVNRSGWTGVVQSLVKCVYDIDARNYRGETALHIASFVGLPEEVKCLVQKKADINAKTNAGVTPLLCAAFSSHKEVFNLLLHAGANVNGRDENGCSVLHYASRNGWTEIVKSVVKRVPGINKRDYYGKTALHYGVSTGLLEVVKCLVEEGANINTKDLMGDTPLLYATKYSHNKDVFKLLLYAGGNVNICGSYKRTVLQQVVRHGIEWLEIMHYLVKRVYDLDAKSKLDYTALHYATFYNHLEVVKCLVEAGANINVKDCDGRTPLLYAAVMRHRGVFDLLFHAGANVGSWEDSKPPVLYYALKYNWIKEVQFLVKQVHDLDARDLDGDTLLHKASVFDCLEGVKCLLEEGADINTKNNKGKTALLLACQAEKLKIVKYLFYANTRCDIADIDGNSPLHYLIRMSRPSVMLIKLFIKKVAVLLPSDYDVVLKSSLLKVDILQDVNFCCSVIVNKFNNYDLPELYKLPVAGSIPCIEEMKIVCHSEVFQTIKRIIRFEIQTKGHCIQLKEHPKVLNILCVKSILEYYDKKKQNCKTGYFWF